MVPLVKKHTGSCGENRQDGVNLEGGRRTVRKPLQQFTDGSCGGDGEREKTLSARWGKKIN